jgi:hypothetical protein
MNEHQPQSSETGPRHRELEPTLEALAVRSEDPIVRMRWKEGLTRWGYAFVAFSQLHLPELHTPDVLTAFEDLYSGSYDSLEAVAEGQIEALGWTDALERFQLEQGITDELLDWNYHAVLHQLSLVLSMIEVDGKVHLFAR